MGSGPGCFLPHDSLNVRRSDRIQRNQTENEIFFAGEGEPSPACFFRQQALFFRRLLQLSQKLLIPRRFPDRLIHRPLRRGQRTTDEGKTYPGHKRYGERSCPHPPRSARHLPRWGRLRAAAGFMWLHGSRVLHRLSLGEAGFFRGLVRGKRLMRAKRTPGNRRYGERGCPHPPRFARHLPQWGRLRAAAGFVWLHGSRVLHRLPLGEAGFFLGLVRGKRLMRAKTYAGHSVTAQAAALIHRLRGPPSPREG